MHRTLKQEAVEHLHEIFKNSEVIVMLHHKGLTVAEIEEVRSEAREVGGGFKVTKNRLAKIAVDNTDRVCLKDSFSGQTAIFYGNDIATTTKVAVDVAKKYATKVTVLNGVYKESLLDKKEIETLSSLPSMDELRGKIVGILQAPMGKLARLIKEPSNKLARIMTMKPD